MSQSLSGNNVEDILLIDNHEIVRIGVKKLLTETFSHSNYAEAGTVSDALALVSDRDWHLAVLEPALEQDDGLRLLKEIKRLRPRVPILVFTRRSEEQYAIRAIKGGAAGYVTKTGNSAELVQAARQIIRGGRYISPSLAETLSAELHRDLPDSVHDLLSARELEILRLIGWGKTVGEISVLLSISDKTVSTYRARILEKTGMKNNAELVRYAVEHRLSL
jgi:two-component system, NarL family, invasion response regulator UvrY